MQDRSLRSPWLKAPSGTCDTHMHFYDDAYMPSPNAPVLPPNATVADYRPVQERLGLERLVVVQPITYGFDNSCTLDAVKQLGDAARAVVTVPSSISDEELADLWIRGARGLRFHQMQGGMTEWSELPRMAERLASTPWHVQVQFDGLELSDREELIARLPCTVVIDHLGRYSKSVSVEHPAFQCLLRLAARENVFVKLSGAYHISEVGGPDYGDIAPLAKALVELDHSRLLWGSDWPHPTKAAEDMPDDADLFDLLLDWVPDDAARQAILVENPGRLYGFGDIGSKQT